MIFRIRTSLAVFFRASSTDRCRCLRLIFSVASLYDNGYFVTEFVTISLRNMLFGHKYV